MELIVAVYEGWGIGKAGTQPIVLKADRKFFRNITKGKTVICGRKPLKIFLTISRCQEERILFLRETAVTIQDLSIGTVYKV